MQSVPLPQFSTSAGWASDFMQQQPIHTPNFKSVNAGGSSVYRESSTLSTQIQKPGMLGYEGWFTSIISILQISQELAMRNQAEQNGRLLSRVKSWLPVLFKTVQYMSKLRVSQIVCNPNGKPRFLF